MKRKILPYNPFLVEYAKKLRNNMTFSEVLLWNEIKKKKLLGYTFNRQRPIGQYIVDFYCKDLMLAIEVDGSSHHWEGKYEKDQIRQKRLEEMGVRFVRIDDLEVKQNMQNVIRKIKESVTELEKQGLIGRE